MTTLAKTRRPETNDQSAAEDEMAPDVTRHSDVPESEETAPGPEAAAGAAAAGMTPPAAQPLSPEEAAAADRAVIDQAAMIGDGSETGSVMPNPIQDADREPPIASGEDFQPDAVDFATRETISVVEGVMMIETARCTSGRWRAGYILWLGKIDKSRPIWLSPTFANKGEAVMDAIEAVGGAIASANGELKGKAATADAMVRQALGIARELVALPYEATED